MSADDRRALENKVKRSFHTDFKQVEASRSDWDSSASVQYTKTPNPDWKFGDGANQTHVETSAKHIAIDPYELGRSLIDNYKLFISAVVPRPIAFISTRSKDGSKENLAPMSFFQMINADPPLFIFAGIIEAVNATSIDAPYGVSEWDISGLTPVYDCQTVSCARVKECIFSIEAKIESIREFESRANPGTKSGTLEVVEATRFWAREDAINQEKNVIDLSILRPISRLGDISYGRTLQAFQLPRPEFEKDLNGIQGFEELKKRRRDTDIQ
ncbi:hypothetical protein TsFJ059_009422 [Trichoderma semiorbis]|uniref:Flavin reductase like domain-containing protein n=1 Tax=Trichoderma semiorbis TaxID=1491008 RepID=A0A9P8KTL0_9HYPO|nr:hypothetical protein TsFJ059_009422 [Trichoderma semiorbis]